VATDATAGGLVDHAKLPDEVGALKALREMLEETARAFRTLKQQARARRWPA